MFLFVRMVCMCVSQWCVCVLYVCGVCVCMCDIRVVYVNSVCGILYMMCVLERKRDWCSCDINVCVCCVYMYVLYMSIQAYISFFVSPYH